ncbi:MAG: VanW family protein [Candidatus Woesebacteria bacterium]|nr:VanW family protein [Candidatus Woesebacteria bacterium]
MLKKNFWDNPHIKNNKERILIFFEILVIIFCISNLAFTGRVFPNTYVAGIGLGGKTEKQAIETLGQKISIPENIRLVYLTQTFDITVGSIDLFPDFSASVQNALGIHRTGNIIYDFKQRIFSFFRREDLGLKLTKNDEKLNDLISVISDQIEVNPIYPSLKIVDGKVVLEKGSIGYKLDRNLLIAKIGHNFSFLDGSDIAISLLMVDPRLNQEEETRFLKRGKKLLDKKLTISYEDQMFTYQKENLFMFLDPNNVYDTKKISDISSEIVNKLNQEPVNSVFVFEEGKVKEFTPSKNGVKANEKVLSQMIVGNLRTLEETDAEISNITVPVTLTPPQVTTSDVNNLGIKELIGTGISYFAGSIPGRIHNVNLAASKFTGVIVPPGETFSFTKTVGDISAQTGYRQAYIISGGKTILGDGGGVCQVSTTLFRAALNAGLPILERTAHAYRVGYYEQSSPPGLDATVYSPTVDLKFKNDTSNHILIQTRVDNKKMMLTFEIYGTNDGRVSTISGSVVTNQIAPPPDVYQDDPTLAIDKVTQTEHKAWGATVTFNYTVERNGETIFKKTFTSKYQPWAAVYLRGTAAVQ